MAAPAAPVNPLAAPAADLAVIVSGFVLGLLEAVTPRLARSTNKNIPAGQRGCLSGWTKQDGG
jgi:hypothetical protein